MSNRLMKLKPNTSAGKIRRKLGKSARERKRTSSRRRGRLEKLATWVSGKQVEVRFRPQQAACEPAPNGSRYDMVVYIPTDEHAQPETDLDPGVWDFVFQKAELVHELGHVIYTDFEAMEEYIDRVDGGHAKALFHQTFNICEDGAIERQLSAKFNVGNDLRIKNANLLTSVEPGTDISGNTRELTAFEAYGTILMDWAKYDVGRAEKLLDPANGEYIFESPESREFIVGLLPIMRDLVADVVTEPDGRERIRIIYEYFQEIRVRFEEAGELETAEEEREVRGGDPDDVNVYVVTPGEPPEDAEALEPDDDDIVIFMDPEMYEGDDEEDPGRRYGQSVEADDEGDDEVVDAIEWQKSVQATVCHLQIAKPGNLKNSTWSKAMRYRSRYRKRLQRVLQAQRESEELYGQRAGRPDTQALWQLGYGNSRVFTNEREPEEKDYNVVLIMDRSGSMNRQWNDYHQHLVEEAEAVTTALAGALEDLGANVAVMSVCGSVYLEKPFGVPVEEKKSTLCRDYADHGTPLTPALELAQDRLDRMGGNSLVFTITDGRPNHSSKFQKVLQKVTFPVVGAYFDGKEPDSSDVRSLYHRITTSDKDGLAQAVEGLIKRMVV